MTPMRSKNCKVYAAPFDVRLPEIENASDENIEPLFSRIYGSRDMVAVPLRGDLMVDLRRFLICSYFDFRVLILTVQDIY